MFRRLATGGLWGVVAVTGLVIVLRAFMGPLPMHIHSPMNAESLFGLAILLILLAQSAGDEQQCGTARHDTWQPCFFAAALIGISVAAFYRSIHFYFLSDDFILVKLANERLYLGPLFTTGGGDGFFRPVGYVSLALTSRWAAFNPALWHGSALAWHIANALLVFVLASQLCSRRIAAFFAAVLFAVHGSRPEAVAWIASVFDRVSTFFLLSGLILFIHSFRNQKRVGLCIPVSAACMTLAILCKESAYVFPFLLLLFMLAEKEYRIRKYGVLIPYFAIAAILIAWRWILFGGIGGYLDLQTGKPLASAVAIVPALKVLVFRLWAVLFFPINWSVQPGIALAILLVAGILGICWIASGRIRRRRLIFPLGFVLLSALPPLHLLLIGSDLQKSRFLYLPSVGFCLLLAVAAEKLSWRGWSLALPAIVVAFNAAALEHNLARWEQASSTAQEVCSAAAQCLGPETRKVAIPGLPGSLDGVYFFANGFPECLQMQGKDISAPALSTEEGPCSAEEHCSRFAWDNSARKLSCR